MRLLPCLLAVILLAGCGSSAGLQLSGTSGKGIVAGAPLLSTANTSRIDTSDSSSQAAAVALTVFPQRTAHTVVLADSNDWHGALAAAVMASAPLGAPVLLSNGSSLGAATKAALAQLKPSLVVRIGDAPPAGAYQSTQIHGSNAAVLAANIAAYEANAQNAVANSVVVVSSDAPQYAMPAAAWAAKSGNPILFVTRGSVPPQTTSAIDHLAQPRIYVLGPTSVIDDNVYKQLGQLGTVARISGPDPVSNAIAFARYSDSAFGWGVNDPGHGLVFASDSNPATAAAASSLSAHGEYGPLLLLSNNATLPATLQQYLLTIQPGYQSDPSRGVYNHGWLVGDAGTIGLSLQGRIDALLAIEPIGGSSSQTTTP